MAHALPECPCADPVHSLPTIGKRVLLLINTAVSTEAEKQLASRGIGVRTYHKVGCAFTALSRLHEAKNLLRGGSVIWLHV